ILDPQGARARVDQFKPAADGSFTYTFPAGGTMKTDGVYKVLVNYRSTEAQTTFTFDATDTGTGGWKPIDVNINGTNHRIDYQITGTGKTLNSMTGDVEAISLVAALT